VSVEIDAEKLH